MLTTFDKAIAGALVSFLATMLARYLDITIPLEMQAALQALIVAAFVWLAPNKTPGNGSTSLQMAPLATVAAITLALMIAGCASYEASRSPLAVRMYAVQADYNTVLVAAVSYESLPRCPAESVCSDSGIVAEIRKADNDAWAAIRAAQEMVRTPGATDGAASSAVSVARAAVDILYSVLRNRGVLAHG